MPKSSTATETRRIPSPSFTARRPETPWRARLRLPLKTAAEISGLSPASLYRAESAGRLVFRRLEGRTLVDTASLIKFIEQDQDWTPSTKGQAGRQARAVRAKAAWRD